MMPTSSTGRANAVAAGAAPSLEGARLHFVGIGGCGMSGLARMARQRGAVVTGSDRAGDSDAVNALRAEGITVTGHQAADAVPADAERVVISAAIPPDHPEVVAARSRGVEVVKYAQMLGALMIGRTGVAVAGTHGKSTTTSILCHTLLRCGLDPSFIVGAHCEQIGGGARVSSHSEPGSVSPDSNTPPTRSEPGPRREILVAEACEYDRSFHHFHPTVAAILNIEADHLDMYRDLDEIIESFATFASRLPAADAGGYLLIGHDATARLTVAAGLDAEVETIGFGPQADWGVGMGEMADGAGRRRSHVTLSHGGDVVAQWRSPLPGEHMAYNAAAAAVLARRLGAGWDAIADAIAGFKGLDRRMQLIGYVGGDGHGSEPEAEAEPEPAPSAIPHHPSATDRIPVIDDYGHHPTEVDTTLRSLRRHYRPDRLICVFQPHQHSRTRHLMEQFAVSFSEADMVLVPDIYFVRDSEHERAAVTAADLVRRLRHQGTRAVHLSPMDAIAEHLRVMLRPGDLVVTMGAGDVWRVARGLVTG